MTSRFVEDDPDTLIFVQEEKKNLTNIGIEDSISSIVKKYLESNVDASSNGISSSHLVGSLVAKGNLQENPMVSFDLLRQQSLDYSMEHTKTLIEKGGETIHGEFKPWLKDASEELRSSISTTITDGINKGKSRDQIKQDLRAIYAGDEARIDKIAGWEIPNAQYRGSMDQYEEDGVELFEWLLGDSPCEVCEPYGEKRYFTADELPPDLPHNHCQCDIAPVSSSQMISMVKRLLHGGEGSGEHEGHEFRGNQWDSGIPSASESIYFERGSSNIFPEGDMDKIRENYVDWEGKTVSREKMEPQAYRGVSNYIQSGFKQMNPYLRSGSLTDSNIPEKTVQKWVSELDLAFEKYSIEVPGGTELWRGVGEKSGEYLASMDVGDICNDKGFQSFSADPGTVNTFARNWYTESSKEQHGMPGVDRHYTVMRAITSGTEKALPGSFTEREYIFNRGSSWQVVSKEVFDAGRDTKVHIVTVVHHG